MIIRVGMADLNVTSAPNTLQTLGLGSCVGLTLWDSARKVGGMAHIMLPSSELAKGDLNVAKYADTAFPKLLDDLVRAGASKRNLVAKIAGGAQMFASTSNLMRIGDRNVEACKKLLSKEGIPLISEDTGGNAGRTIELNCDNGLLSIRTISKGSRDI